MTISRFLLVGLLTAPILATEPAKDGADGASADVVLTGRIGSVQQVASDGKTATVVSLTLAPDITVLVTTAQELSTITSGFKLGTEKRMKELKTRIETNLKRQKENNDLFLAALDANDTKRVEALGKVTEAILKENATINKEMLALGKEFGLTAVAEGRLEFRDKSWRLVGSVRPWDPEGKDRTLAADSAHVRGAVEAGEYKVGKETSRLAVRTGGLLVVVSGEAAESRGKVQGEVRATGRLELAKDGSAVLDAATFEPVKK